MNSLFQDLNKNQNPQAQPQPQNDAMATLIDAVNFAKNFKGNAKEQVQRMISSGRVISNEEIQQANMIYSMLTGRK